MTDPVNAAGLLVSGVLVLTMSMSYAYLAELIGIDSPKQLILRGGIGKRDGKRSLPASFKQNGKRMWKGANHGNRG